MTVFKMSSRHLELTIRSPGKRTRMVWVAIGALATVASNFTITIINIEKKKGKKSWKTQKFLIEKF